MLYIELQKFEEGEHEIKPNELYFVKDTELEHTYKMMSGTAILSNMKNDEINGKPLRYINATSTTTFLTTRYNRPNTGITAVIYNDKLVRDDFNIMELTTVYKDRGVSVFVAGIAKYYFPIVIEKSKDALGYNVDIHFCSHHENFVSTTSNVSIHFQSIDSSEKSLIFDLVFKYDTERGVFDRNFGRVTFTSEGIFLAGGYHPLFDYDSLFDKTRGVSAWKSL